METNRRGTRKDCGEDEVKKRERILLDILQERNRQIDDKGFDGEHDDGHEKGELAKAGGCYAIAAFWTCYREPVAWPWDRKWWKPKTPEENLIRAAALIVAELEKVYVDLPDAEGGA